MKGTKVDSTGDTKRMKEELQKRLNLPTLDAVNKWLKNADDGFGGKGLRLHHAGGNTVELIPARVHKVSHTDMTH